MPKTTTASPAVAAAPAAKRTAAAMLEPPPPPPAEGDTAAAPKKKKQKKDNTAAAAAAEKPASPDGPPPPSLVPTSPDEPPPGLYIAPWVQTRGLPPKESSNDAFLANNIGEIVAAATHNDDAVVLENRLNVTRRDASIPQDMHLRYFDDVLRLGRPVVFRGNANGLEPSILPIISNHRALNTRVLPGLYLTNTNRAGTGYTPEFNRDKWTAPVYGKGPCTDRAVRLGVGYAFDKMKTAVVVRVVAGRVAAFLPLFNVDGYTNDFADLLRFDDASRGNYAGFVKRKQRGGRSADVAPLRNWAATNCLLLTGNDDRGPTTGYLAAVYDMLASTLAFAEPGSVRDSVFLFNRKDFPILDAFGNEAYHAVYGQGRPLPDKYRPKPPKSMKGGYGGSTSGTAPEGGFIGVCSQSTTDGHADLPLPTADDWAAICRDAYFADWMSRPKEFQCTNPAADNYAAYSVAAAKPWLERRAAVVWRGQNTGCGSTPDTNPRMRLAMLSASGAIPGLDAGITHFTHRDKVDPDTHTVVPAGSVPRPKEIAEPVAELTPVAQLHYRFVINVEGNSAAYRYGGLLGGGQVVINVESRYKLWFEPLLTELRVAAEGFRAKTAAEIRQAIMKEGACVLIVRHDLADLAETVRWCLDPANEDLCARLAANARAFHQRVMNRDFVRRYVADVLNGFGARMATATPRTDASPATDLDLRRGQRLQRDTLDLPPSAAQLAAWREDQVAEGGQQQQLKNDPDRVLNVFRMEKPRDLSAAALRAPPVTNLLETGLVVVVPFHTGSTTDADLATALRARLRKCVAHYGAFANVLVVEQAGSGEFNRGALQNAAVRLLRLKRTGGGELEHFVFVDADLLLPKELLGRIAALPPQENVEALHVGDMVRSMTETYGDKTERAARDAGRPGASYFLGGALALTPRALDITNGFPNHFRGTGGGETAALAARLARKGVTVHRFPQSMPTTGLLGARVDGRRLDTTSQRNTHEAHDLQLDLACAEVNGLNSIQFRLVAMEALDDAGGRSAFCARVQID